MRKHRYIKIMTVFSTVILIITFCAIILNNESVGFKSNKINFGTWHSSNSSLGDNESKDTFNYLGISSFYDYDTNGVIDPETIITNQETAAKTKIVLNSGLDLYAFSMICNNEEYGKKYLTYHYVLGDNIDYTDAAKFGNYFVPIGRFNPEDRNDQSKFFSGTFDGQGFEIKNLLFQSINSVEDYNNNYKGLNYLSMFSVVGSTGIVCNFGVVDTVILQGNVFEEMFYASHIVGINYGLVHHVYAIDMRAEESGVTADGGYFLSGLMCENYGNFRDSYTIYTQIISSSVNYNRGAAPILLNNYGTINDLYYDLRIHEGSLSNIEYKIPTGVQGVDYQFFVNGAYFANDLVWFNASSYDSIISESLDIKYPILQGLHYQTSGEFTGYYGIETAVDYVYMNKLLTNTAFFRAAKYVVMANINLASVSASALASSNAIFTGIFTSQKVLAEEDKVTLSNGKKSDYYTIFSANITSGVSSTGYTSYGIFPLSSGVIKNVNFYNVSLKPTDLFNASLTSEVKCLGLLVGRNTGTIENVNVNGIIDLVGTTSTYQNFGKIYIGGIAGYSSGSILKATSSGSIEGGNHNYTANSYDTVDQISGALASTGGIVGYTNFSTSIEDCLNNMKINAPKFNNSNAIQYVGGIAGCANTNNFSKVSNYGSINLNSNNHIIYGAGIIGRHLGARTSIFKLYNQGDISVNITNQVVCYISGVLNANELTSAEYFSITNASNLSVTTNGVFSSQTSFSFNFAGVMYLNETNATIKSVYNMNSKYSDNGKIVYLKNQEIDMSIIWEYAPCIVVDNSTTSTTISQSYNYRNIDYITKNPVYFLNLQCSGNISGTRINYEGIKNYGDIKINITKDLPVVLNSLNKMLKVFGCFYEVTDGFVARNIYNGGKIEVTAGSSLTKLYMNVYVGGICYKNAQNDTYIKSKGNSTNVLTAYNNVFNPLTEGFDKTIVGTIDNAINDGEIYVHSEDLDTFTPGKNVNSFKGAIRIGGICPINSSVLTSCFNTGDIYSLSYILAPVNGSYYFGGQDFENEVGGLVYQNTTRYAQIRDCANYGEISAVNLSSSNSWVNAAGIVARNEKLENNGSYGNQASHCEQIIVFTINYGDIRAFNYDVSRNAWVSSSSPFSSQEEPSKASGILCLGVCNIINVVNYGNIYGSHVSSGIYGYVYMSKHNTEISTLYICNTINYGVAQSQSRYKKYDKTEDTSLLELVSSGGNNTTTLTNNFGFTVGALIGVLDANSYAYFNTRVNIRYLINFNENGNILGDIMSFSSGSVSVENMATVKSSDTSPAPFSGIKSFSLSTNAPDYTQSDSLSAAYNGGVFYEKFPLRNVVVSGEAPTDRFISEYIQFVPYSKVNQILMSKIGWDEIVTQTAIRNMLQSYNTVYNKIMNNESIVTSSEIETLYSNFSSQLINLVTANEEDNAIILSKIILSDAHNSDVAEILDYLLTNNEALINGDKDFQDIIIQVLTNTNLSTIDINTIYQTIFSSQALDISFLKSVLLTVLLEKDAQSLKTFASDLVQNYDNYSNLYLLISDTEIRTLLYEIFDRTEMQGFLDELLKQAGSSTVTGVDEYLASLSELEKNALLDSEININLNHKIVVDTLSNDAKKKLFSSVSSLDTGYFEVSLSNLTNVISFWEEIRNELDYSFLDSFTDTLDYYEMVEASEGNSISGANIYYGWSSSTKRIFAGDYNFDSSTQSYKLASNYFKGYTNIAFGTSSSGTRYRFSNQASIQNPLKFSGTSVNYGTGNTITTSSNSTGFYATSSDLLTVYYGSHYGQSGRLNFANISASDTATISKIKNGEYSFKDSEVLSILGQSLLIESNRKVITDAIFSSASITDINLYLQSSVNLNQAFINENFSSSDLDIILKDYYKVYPDRLNLKIKIETIVLESIKDKSFYNSVLKTLFENLNNSDYIKIITQISAHDFFNITETRFSEEEKRFLIQQAMKEEYSLFLLVNQYLDNLDNQGPKKSEVLELLLKEFPSLTKEALQKITNLTLEEKKILLSLYSKNIDSLENHFLFNQIESKGYSLKNIDEFNAFMESINEDPGQFTDFVGIYAMASSYGITNGKFIPDNINLQQLDDVHYIEDENGNVIEERNGDWRGGSDNSYQSESDLNYKIFKGMKQLKLSIATSIFDVELISSSGNIINTISSEIDNNNKTITFYIATNDPNLRESYWINTAVGTYEISFNASLGVCEEVTVDSAGSIEIIAEDTTVRTIYQINLIATKEKKIDTISVQMGNTIVVSNSTQDNITISNQMDKSNSNLLISGNISNASLGEDIKKDIKIKRGNSYEIFNYSFPASFENNGIVTDASFDINQLVWSGGKYQIYIEFSESLQAGDYAIEINLGVSALKTIRFSKAQSSECDIEEIFYKGQSYTPSNNTITSYILYGEKILKSDLEKDREGIPVYLDDISLSSLAKIESFIATVSSNNGINTYTVTFEIVAEDGSTKIFYHNLIEKAPNLQVNQAYKDGLLINNENSYSFEKTDNPAYSFHYDLNNFSLGDNTSLGVFEDNGYDNISIISGVGFEVHFLNISESKSYYFTFQYTSLVWGSGSNNLVERIVSSNSIQITKNKNTESKLTNVRFISETVLSSINTIVEKKNLTEEEYLNLYNGVTPREAICLPSGIYYNNYANEKEFWMIGIVSKTQLSNYSPSFTLADAATIFRVVEQNGYYYRYVSYNYTVGESVLTQVFLIREDFNDSVTTVLNPYTLEIINIDNVSEIENNLPTSFNANSTVYTVSSVAGTSLDKDALSTSFDLIAEDGGFMYYEYRSYAEGFNGTNGLFTINHIAVRDITNNVRFFIQIEDKTGEIQNVNLSLIGYITNENYDPNDSTSEQILFNNQFSMFATRVAGTNILANRTFAPNTSGSYRTNMSLPTGYTYIFYLTDSNFVKNADAIDYTKDTLLEVESTVYTKLIYLKFEITKNDDKPVWGETNSTTLK